MKVRCNYWRQCEHAHCPHWTEHRFTPLFEGTAMPCSLSPQMCDWQIRKVKVQCLPVERARHKVPCVQDTGIRVKKPTASSSLMRCEHAGKGCRETGECCHPIGHTADVSCHITACYASPRKDLRARCLPVARGKRR